MTNYSKSEFAAAFTCYRSGARLLSSEVRFMAHNFDAAIAHANALLAGMRHGAGHTLQPLEVSYELLSIRAVGYSGTQCVDEPGNMWKLPGSKDDE